MPLYTPDSLTPAQLGLPSQKFPAYRPAQLEIAEFGLYGAAGYLPEAVYLPLGDPRASDLDPRRPIAAIGAPGGIGKTLACQTIGRLSGSKYAVVTPTRGLEDQIVEDGFDTINVRGRDNYQCQSFDPTNPSKRWSCKVGEEAEEGETEYCQWANTAACTYGQRVGEAKQHGSIVTNYAYWMHARNSNRQALQFKQNPIQLLILDEVHQAFSALASYLGCWISEHDLLLFAKDEAKALLKKAHGQSEPWGKVGTKWLEALAVAADGAGDAVFDADRAGDKAGKRKWQRVAETCMRVADIGGDGNWIWQLTRNGIQFDCVWPYRYTDRYLFSGVGRVVLVSATLRPKCMSLLGLSRERYDFREWPRQFPPHLSPVYWLPTVRMSYSMPASDKKRMVERVDEIASARRDRKGIVHTGSYALAEYIQSHSRLSRSMILNPRGKGEAHRAAEKFRQAGPGTMLVSPSYGTGWDFPSTDCEFQIIAKLPFPDMQSPIAQARKSDNEYVNYVTMQDLVQATMRGSRHFTDRAETFIIDDTIRNFQFYAKQHAPRWFRVRRIVSIPPLPPKM
jgi:Rad3-related DNA helicase